MIEEAREEVKGLVRRVEWLADVVLLLLIPDIAKLLSRESGNTEERQRLTLDGGGQGRQGRRCCNQAGGT